VCRASCRVAGAFLTGTRLGGVEALRACVLHPGTTEADLGVLLEEIREA
jgi:aromatic-L-amino-acid decarboxylase